MFGRLLQLAFGVSIDLQVILAYSITPVPASLAHIDGPMYKTNKASLLKNLQPQAPSTRDACVIDGMFLISTLVDIPVRFG